MPASHTNTLSRISPLHINRAPPTLHTHAHTHTRQPQRLASRTTTFSRSAGAASSTYKVQMDYQGTVLLAQRKKATNRDRCSGKFVAKYQYSIARNHPSSLSASSQRMETSIAEGATRKRPRYDNTRKKGRRRP